MSKFKNFFQSRLIHFTVYHLIIALSLYYLLFIILDILSGGLVSFFFPAGALIVAILILVFILTFLPKEYNQKTRLKISKPAFLTIMAGLCALMFVALLPHDFLTSLITALAVFALGLVNWRQ